MSLSYRGFAPRARVLRQCDPELYKWLQWKFRVLRANARRHLYPRHRCGPVQLHASGVKG